MCTYCIIRLCVKYKGLLARIVNYLCYTVAMKEVPTKIRNSKMWKNVYALAEEGYDMASDILLRFPDEKWDTAGKLKTAACDSLFAVSQALGGPAPESAYYDWNYSRKSRFTFQSIYTFAARQKYFMLDPQIVVTIDRLIDEIDEQLAICKKKTKEKDQEDMGPWLERYRIWQKINDKK